MKSARQIKKFIVSFAISTFFFFLAAIIISSGLSDGRTHSYSPPKTNGENIQGESFNLLLVMCDYAPDKFNDYHPNQVKNVLGNTESLSQMAGDPTSLTGYRKVHTENMVLICFDKEREKLSFTPISGNTLVNVKGVQIKLEEVAGEWGIQALIDKIHAMTGVSVNRFAVFSPQKAVSAIDLLGPIDYTIKCNMNYKIEERGIDINLSAGTYRLDGEITVNMLRFDGYGSLNISRSEVTLGYVKRLLSKLSADFSDVKLKEVIDKTLNLSYNNFDSHKDTDKINLMLSFNKLEFEVTELVGSWQTVKDARYFVLDETKTLEKFAAHRFDN